MIRSRSRLFLLALLCGVILAAEVRSSAPAPVDWLAGCWRSERGSLLIEEQWMAPAGGSMVGMSRTLREGRLVAYEFLLIRDTEDGLVYEAHPSGQSHTVFRAREWSDTLLVFENPEHDFPQRILYRRLGADSVHARIEGEREGTVRGVDFPFERVACASAPPSRLEAVEIRAAPSTTMAAAPAVGLPAAAPSR